FEGAYVIKNLNSPRENFEVLNQSADEQTAIAISMGLKPKGPYFQQFSRVSDEVTFYRALGKHAMAIYAQDPKLIFTGLAHNTWAFWTGGRTRRATIFNTILALPLLLLSGIGLAI